MNNGYRENVPSPKRLAKVPPLIGIVIAYTQWLSASLAKPNIALSVIANGLRSQRQRKKTWKPCH